MNCAPDLAPVARAIAAIVRPGGTVLISIMPKYALWEIVTNVVRGNVRTAFRRWRSAPVPARVHGVAVPTHYPSVRDIITAFREHFALEHCEAWNVISPPPSSKRFRRRYPRLSAFLERTEPIVAELVPFNRMGDHVLLEFRRT